MRTRTRPGHEVINYTVPAYYTVEADDEERVILDAWPQPGDRMGEHASATFEAMATIMDIACDDPLWAKGAIKLRYWPDGYDTYGDSIVIQEMESKE